MSIKTAARSVSHHKVKAWLWPIPFLLVSLTLMGATVVYAIRQPYDGLGWSSISGKIETIDPDGPAAKTDLQVGDILTAIDGIPVLEAVPLYAGKQAGNSVTLSVLRQGKSLQVKITLAQADPSLLARRLAPALIALGLWLISGSVLALRPASQQARLFFAASQVGSMALLAGRLSTFGPEVAGRLFALSLCWLSPLLIHFHSIFPVYRPGFRHNLKFFYGAALALSWPYVVWSLPRLKLFSGYSFLYNGVQLYFASALLVGVMLLFRNYGIATSQAARRQIRLVVLGTALAFTPLVWLALVPEILQGRPLIPYELAFLFFLAIPLAYGYAIYRHNLFQTDRVLNRSLVYLSLALLWGSLYLALATLVSWLFPTARLSGPLLGTLLILVMSWALPTLQKKAQGLVDRFFYGGWYDYGAVVGRFSQALNATLEETALAELLVEQLPTTLRARGAALLVSVGGGSLVAICPRNDVVRPCDAPGRCLACQALSQGMLEEGALACFLQREKGPVETSRLRRALAGQELAPDEVALLNCEGIEVWLPLVFQGELEGILLLGAKLADDVYSDEDYDILKTLAWQAATTARNVRLVRELRQRLEEITQSKQELQAAHRRLLAGREEERKRLAREIHDGPVQELVGVSYWLRDYARQAGESALAEPLGELRRQSLHLLEELRHICAELRPPVLDVMGLAAAIHAHAEEEIKAGPPITLDLDDTERLSKDLSISLFRIYQEAMTNVIRHANATRITVQLKVSSDACILTVRDDGQGFVVPPSLEGLTREGHFGLLGMRERAEALGGWLEVISTPGAGTEVRVWAPLDVKCEA